jgi:hypothetical protein
MRVLVTAVRSACARWRLLLCGAVFVVPVHLIPPPAPASTVPLGFYVGAAEPTWLGEVASGTGTLPGLAEDFLPSGQGWAGISQESRIGWLLNAWQGTSYQLVLGVPMIPTAADGKAVGTLATGARGSYDIFYRTLARNLVAHGEGNAVLRLGWEFNGNWYAWSVRNPIEATEYAAYFRQIVRTMRTVSHNFRFVWNLSNGSGAAYDFTSAYPGNGYVDFIGDDVYDESCATVPTPQGAWSTLLTDTAGLDWVSGFAAAHHKALAIPEWGIDSGTTGGCAGLGDQPSFVVQMAEWLTAHDAAFSIYFDVNAPDGSHKLGDRSFPRALAAFQGAFGTTLLQQVIHPAQRPVITSARWSRPSSDHGRDHR